MQKPLHVIILAAGEGKRMKSLRPKVLQRIAGCPMLGHTVATARSLAAAGIHVVYGHGGDQVQAAFAADADLHWAEQAQQLGTGHAVLQAMPGVPDGAQVLVLYADVPLITETTLRQLLAAADGGTAVLTEGAEYKPVAMSMRESQFLETLRFGVEEICRLYKVPPHKVGHMEGAGYSNSIEAQNAQFVTDCIRPLVELIEMEFTNKVLNGNRRFNLDMRALMRGDIMTQVQRNVSYWNIGVMSANEIRKEEGLAPIPDGDTFNKPMHMAPQNDVNNGQQGNTEPPAA